MIYFNRKNPSKTNRTNRFLHNTFNLKLVSNRCEHCGSLLDETLIQSFSYITTGWLPTRITGKNMGRERPWILAPQNSYNFPNNRKLVKNFYITGERFEQLTYILYCTNCGGSSKARLIINSKPQRMVKSVGINYSSSINSG